MAGKKLGFLKKVFRFYCTKIEHDSTIQKHMRKKTSHTWYALPLLTNYSKQNYKHHMKNEDKIDESHKLQLKFEYEI